MSTQGGEAIGYFTSVFDDETFLSRMLIKISREHSLGTLPEATQELT